MRDLHHTADARSVVHYVCLSVRLKQEVGCEELWVRSQLQSWQIVGIPARRNSDRSESSSTASGGNVGMAGEAIVVSAINTKLSARQAYAMAAIYLLVGLAVGYLVRNSESPSISPHPAATAPRESLHPGAMSAGHLPTAQQIKQMADKQAAPLMEKLKSDPNDSALLMQVGAIYYTTGQYREASAYYDRALRSEPAHVGDRVKLAPSLYREGDVDTAIAQLNKALTYDPKNADALFDIGMIKLQGKQDSKGALAAWRQLLKSNPQMSADHKSQVQRLIAGVALGDAHGREGAADK